MNFLYCLILSVLLGVVLSVQPIQEYAKVSELTASWIDPMSEDFQFSRIESPMANYSFADWRDRSLRGADCPCTSIFEENTYSGGTVPQELIDALGFAQCLWSCIIDLPANSVQLQVVRTSAAPGVLASAGPMMAQVGNKAVPCALADCDGPDIQMNVDPTAANYYYGLDGHPGASQYDFVTIALHELGHGFGIIGYASNADSGYRLPPPTLCDFDAHIKYGSGFPWGQNPPASNAVSAVTSGQLYFSGNTYQDTKLYSPSSYSSGSSIYHLDEHAYPAGNADSLMTPMLSNGEAIHSVGRRTCDALMTVGYSIPSWEACDSAAATGSAPAPSAPAPSGATPSPSPMPQYPPSGTPTSQNCTCTGNTCTCVYHFG